jgi:hypothetical protein
VLELSVAFGSIGALAAQWQVRVHDRCFTFGLLLPDDPRTEKDPLPAHICRMSKGRTLPIEFFISLPVPGMKEAAN